MTENKRFTINLDDECIDDAQEEIFIHFTDTIDFVELCKLLNGLDGTIKSLTKDYEQLLKKYKELKEEFEQSMMVMEDIETAEHKHKLLNG